jgi:signal transduction histidine kinase
VRDLSERVRLEAELRRRETLAAMGSLVAGVAHEVRTPLFSLSASLDALEAGSGTPEERRELKDLLRSQVGRLSDLMRDLLEYARPSQLDLVRGSIAEPLRLARNTCGTLASRNGVRLSLDVPDSLPPVRLDPGRVEEVFENLIANAVQHSPQGATVTIRAHALGAPRPGVRCTVEDEGPGLALEDIGHVFEPFFSRRKGGTGLGLAIAQRFVEAHGGTIGVANRPAGGALFTVVLHDSLEAPEPGRG